MSKGTILTDANSYNKALAEAENYHKDHLQDNLKRIKEKNQKIEEFASGKYDEITSNVDKVFQTIDQSISKTNNFIKVLKLVLETTSITVLLIASSSLSHKYAILKV